MPITKKATTTSTKRNTKSASNLSENAVSVITKTTTPKVVVQTEKVDSKDCCSSKKCESGFCIYRFMKFLCMIVVIMIILFTFFLSLKTYNIVTELGKLIL